MRLLCKLFALLFVANFSLAGESAMSDDKAVESAVSKMLFAVDRLDWSGVRAALADEVELDYTSLFGGQPERLKTDTLLQRWQGLLPGFDATQHLTGPVVLTSRNEKRGTAETHVRAHHYVRGESADEWMIAGHYVMQVEQTASGWKISGIRLIVYHQQGNTKLPAIAMDRVKAGRSRNP